MRYLEDLAPGEPHTFDDQYTVTKDDIISFAKQWDPQPHHVDEQAAEASPMGRLFASSFHTMSIASHLSHKARQGEDVAVVAGLGWDELRFKQPVCVGDSLHLCVQTLVVRDSNSQPSRGIITTGTQVLNQRDEVVASFKMSVMVLKRPVA